MFGKLESLRGVAACIVVLFHSPFLIKETQLQFMQNSYLFVDFFFILSGFVMAFAYGDKIRRDLSFGRYITLRLGRIYPLHLCMLLAWIPYILAKQYLYNAGFGGTDPSEKSNIFSFASNLLLLHSMGVHDYIGWNYPSWSISTEFFAYVAFYIVSVTVDRHKTVFVPFIIAALGYWLLLSLDRPSLDITYDFGFIRCLAAFYIGVLLLRLRWHELNISSPNARNLFEVAAALLLIVCVYYASSSQLMLMLTIASFALVLVVFANSGNGFLGKLLETTPMRQLGIWSYSMYMLHALVWAGVSNIFEHVLKFDLDAAQGWLAIVMNTLLLAIIIVLSRFSYIYIEKYFRDKIKHWVTNFRKEAPVPASLQ